MEKKIKIIIFGDYYWSYLFYEKVQLNQNFEIKLFVTSKKKEKTFISNKRKIIIKKTKLIESSNLDSICRKLDSINYDFILSIAYSKIFKGNILKRNFGKILNIHPSFLPLRRGPDPIRNGILKNDKNFGVSLHLVDSLIDSGKLISRYKLKNNQKDNTKLILDKFANKFFKYIFLDIINFSENKVKFFNQNNFNSFAPKITDDLLQISKKDSLNLIKRKIRATLPFRDIYLGDFGKRIKIKEISFKYKKNFTKFVLTRGSIYIKKYK